MSGKLFELLIDRKAIKPLWIMSDLWDGKHTGGKFVCFIGAHWEPGFVGNEEKHKEAWRNMQVGTWKAEALAAAEKKGAKGKLIGWGVGASPAEAFRMACKMSGHLPKD